MSKTKYPRAEALAVAKLFCDLLKPGCERLIVAGSLRRRKMEVGDIEILYIPKFSTVPDGLFDTKRINWVDELLNLLLRPERGLAKRKNVKGSEMWGDKNKLGVHLPTGIPVDFFAATEENWFNYLVCRTGSAESNMAICNAAIAKGWKWNPYGRGFSKANAIGGEIHQVNSEREVFDFGGLAYKEPWER